MDPKNNETVLLSLEEILHLVRLWERDPLIVNQVLIRGDEQINISKEKGINEVQKIAKIKFQGLEDWNHARIWIEAEAAVLEFIDTRFKENQTKQPSPEQLQQWEKSMDEQKKQAEVKKTSWDSKKRNWKTKLEEEQKFTDSQKENIAIERADKEFIEEFALEKEIDLPYKDEEPLRQVIRGSSYPQQNIPKSTPVSGSQLFIQRVQQNSGNIGWGDWLRNPIGTFRKWWGDRGTVSSGGSINKISGLGKENTLSGVEKHNILSGMGKPNVLSGLGPTNVLGGIGKSGVIKGVASGVGSKALGAVSGPVGWAVLAVQVLKDKKTWDKIKNAIVKLGALDLYLSVIGLMTNLVAGSVGMAGGVVGAIVGAKAGAAVGAAIGAFGGPLAWLTVPVGTFVGGVIGGLVGFGVGFVSGYGLGTIVSNSLGMGGGIFGNGAAVSMGGTYAGGGSAGGASAGGSFSGTASAVTSGLWTSLSNAGAAVIAPLTAGVVLVSSIAMSIIAALAGAAVVAASIGQQTGNDNLEVEFKIVPNSFPDYSSGISVNPTCTYKISVPGEKKVNISSVSLKATINYLKNGQVKSDVIYQKSDLFSGQINSGSDTGDKNCNFPIESGNPDYVNSEISVVLVVIGRVDGGTEDETKTRTQSIFLGERTQIARPFGYPADGTIKSLDMILGHCGTFLTNGMSRVCIPGGIDVSGPAGTPVFATMDGTVELAIVDDNGDCTNSATSTNGFGHCAWALAGVVYINNGPFEAAYLHLDQVSVTTGQTVTRGVTQLGVTHGIVNKEEYCWTSSAGKHICTIGGPHVHYQVRENGYNKDFFNSYGSCKQGDLLPVSPVPDLDVYVQKGPFTCD